MKIKAVISSLMLITVLSSFAGCTGSGDGSSKSGSKQDNAKGGEYPVEVYGETIKKQPAKVVSMSPSITEMIYDLGYDGQLAAVSDFTAYPDRAKNKPACGTVQLPNLQQIENAAPEVIFASSNFSEADLIKLQQMNAEVIIVPKAVSLEQMKTNYINIAKALGGKTSGEKNAEDVYFNISKKFTEAQRAIKSYISQSSNAQQSAVILKRLDFNVATGDTFENNVLKSLMLTNPAEGYTGWVFPKEKKAELNPGVIFYDTGIDEKTLTANATYKGLIAIKSQRTMQIDLSIFDQQGGRIFDVMYEMAKFAYPKAFEGESSASSSSKAA